MHEWGSRFVLRRYQRYAANERRNEKARQVKLPGLSIVLVSLLSGLWDLINIDGPRRAKNRTCQGTGGLVCEPRWFHVACSTSWFRVKTNFDADNDRQTTLGARLNHRSYTTEPIEISVERCTYTEYSASWFISYPETFAFLTVIVSNKTTAR